MARRTVKPGETLTDMEARFVREYLIDLSQAKAIQRADGTGKEKNWRQLGYQMMQRPHVAAAIDRAMAERGKRLDTKADDVLREIARLAMFDPGHITGVTCPEDIAMLPEDVRRAIVGWSWDKNGNFTVKLAKEGALEMLGRHHGLFRERVEHSGPGGGPIPVASQMTDEQLLAIASRGRAAKAQ